MHTSEIKYTNGVFTQDFTIHHNGDFSGDMVIDIPEHFRTGPGPTHLHRVEYTPEVDAERVGVYIPAQYEVRIPFEVLAELVGRKIIAEKISQLESLTGVQATSL